MTIPKTVFDVIPVYREHAPGSHARRSGRAVHMARPGAPRILCDTDTFVDEATRPPGSAAITCSRCRKLAGSGQYERVGGGNLLALDGAPDAFGHRLTIVVPSSQVAKLRRLAATYGLSMASVLTMALGAFPEAGAADGPIEPAPGYRCRHPGQKFNHARDAGTIDRVCQACHAVVETVPRCPGTRPDGSQCRAFIRPPFVACSVHKATIPA